MKTKKIHREREGEEKQIAYYYITIYYIEVEIVSEFNCCNSIGADVRKRGKESRERQAMECC